MQFNRRRYTLNAFDGKIILALIIDFPTEEASVKYDYLSRYALNCYNFATTELYETVKTRYISEYQNGIPFKKYSYKLEIKETYSTDAVFSYLITATLETGGEELCRKFDAVVFNCDLIVPQKLLGKGKAPIALDKDGTPCRVDHRDGIAVLNKISKSKFSI